MLEGLQLCFLFCTWIQSRLFVKDFKKFKNATLQMLLQKEFMLAILCTKWDTLDGVCQNRTLSAF